jgi:hypothetical protein
LRILISLLQFLTFLACGDDAANLKAKPKAQASADGLGQLAEPLDEDSVFVKFCRFLESNPITETENLQAKLCLGSQPSKLLALKLPEIAYEGSGDVKLLSLAPVTHDKELRTTTVAAALGISVPTSAAKYFNRSTEFMDDPKYARSLGIRLVEGLEKLETLETYEDAKTSQHVRGWKKRNVIKRDVSGNIVNSEYISRQDHYRIEEKKVYLISGYLMESIEGIKESQMVTAIISDNTNPEGYCKILSVLITTSENRGLPSLAQSTIIDVIKSGVKNVFANGLIIEGLK